MLRSSSRLAATFRNVNVAPARAFNYN